MRLSIDYNDVQLLIEDETIFGHLLAGVPVSVEYSSGIPL